MSAPPVQRRGLVKIGRSILRLRLFWRWSQAELGRRAKVSQSTISRLERGAPLGMSIRRLGAVMDALRVHEVTFDKPPTVPQTDLEIMLFGNPWERAGKEADRRLGWVRPGKPGSPGNARIEDAG